MLDAAGLTQPSKRMLGHRGPADEWLRRRKQGVSCMRLIGDSCALTPPAADVDVILYCRARTLGSATYCIRAPFA